MKMFEQRLNMLQSVSLDFWMGLKMACRPTTHGQEVDDNADESSDVVHGSLAPGLWLSHLTGLLSVISSCIYIYMIAMCIYIVRYYIYIYIYI